MVKELNKENFENETKEGVCVIDFWASWCGPCRMMAPVIERLAEKRSELKFFKVNVDEQEELAMKFNVMSIPTFVALRDGKLTATTLGYMPEETLVSELGI
ncbi:MAG: thioredoxin [Clostridia bacterium]|nr:thioredoxin [Clostridia bacterium]